MARMHPGNYRAEILAATLGAAKSGNPQIEFIVRVLGYYDAQHNYYSFDDEPVPTAGTERRIYLTLTEKTLGTEHQPGWVWTTLVELGFVGPSFADLGPLVGQVRNVECEHEASQEPGSVRERWRFRLHDSAKPMQAADAGLTQRLDDRFAGLLQSRQQQQPQRRPQRQPQRRPQQSANGGPITARPPAATPPRRTVAAVQAQRTQQQQQPEEDIPF